MDRHTVVCKGKWIDIEWCKGKWIDIERARGSGFTYSGLQGEVDRHTVVCKGK